MAVVDNTIILRVRGLPLMREPHAVDANGWSVFHLNGDKVDWAESCNRARGQVFPNVRILEFDPVYEQIMKARRDRAAAEALA